MKHTKKIGKGWQGHRSVWKVITVICTVSIIASAIALLLVISNKSMDNNAINNDQIVSTAAPLPTAGSIKGAKNYAAAIVINLNPSVEIRLDAGDLVTEVVGLNEDGITLIEGIDFTGLSLENATIIIVNQLILQGYITAAEIQNEINISLISDNMTIDTLSIMTDIIKAAAAEQNIAVDVIANEETNELQIVLDGQGSPEIWPGLEPQNDDSATNPPDSTLSDTPSSETPQPDAEPADTIPPVTTLPDITPTETSPPDTTPMETPPEEFIEIKDREPALDVEFIMAGGTHSAYVDNVLIHTSDGQTINNLLDFAGMSLGKAALLGIVELIDKEYISDYDQNSVVRLSFSGSYRDGDINSVVHLAKLLTAEYGLRIAVIPDFDSKQILLGSDSSISHEKQESKYSIKDVLNYMLNKDEGDLSPRQIEILKAAYNYREYYRLLEKRYFIVIPNLTGMTEEQAIDVMEQLGIPPLVVRQKVPGYDPTKENGGLDLSTTSDQKEPYEDQQSQGQEMTWEYPVVDFGCVYSQDIGPGSTYQAGLPMQISVIVPEDDDRPEVLDLREDSGIVIREMDIPFDVSAYPDTFLLSEASGFDAIIKEMNVTYGISDKADYTVIINRDLGWEDTAMITITHKDGFPQSKFFVQQGRIIEHEFLWRRDSMG